MTPKTASGAFPTNWHSNPKRPWSGPDFPTFVTFRSFRPIVSSVVVSDVATQQTEISLVNNQADIAIDANRPEILVPSPIEFVKLQSRIGWIQLQFKGSRLDRVLFVACQFGEAVRKRVGDSKLQIYVHQ